MKMGYIVPKQVIFWLLLRLQLFPLIQNSKWVFRQQQKH